MLDPYDSNANIADLPGCVGMILEKKLSVNNAWMKLVRVCPGYSSKDIDDFSITPCPAKAFVTDLIIKQMTLKYLRQKLHEAGLTDVLHHLDNQGELKINSQSHSGDVDLFFNDTITLNVSASGNPPLLYQWYKYTTPLRGKTFFQLVIDNFSMNDENVYTCAIFSNTRDKVVWSKPIRLNLIKSPPSLKKDLKDAEVIEGNKLILHCLASGIPPLVYTWIKDSEKSIKTASDDCLIIDEVDIIDSGIYKCLVSNPYGKCESSSAYITVHSKLSIPNGLEIIKQPYLTRSDCQIGEEISLECKVRSSENVTFKWFLNGTSITDARLFNHQENAYEFCCLLRYEINERDPKLLRFNCKVSSVSHEFLSKDVSIHISDVEGGQTTIAGLKLALLIGNSNYDSSQIQDLKTPAVDIQDIGRKLKTLGFLCFTFTNLNYHEMLNAIEFFSKLISKEDYVVFYFGGHSYGVDIIFPVPINEEETHMMIPTVKNLLQENDPALLFIILDTCRPQVITDEAIMTDRTSPAKRNCVVLHATSVGHSAFEDSKHSFLTHALLKHLTDEVNIVEMLQKINRCVEKIETLYEKHFQIPVVEFDLSCKRGLCDPSFSKDTGRFDRLSMLTFFPQNIRIEEENKGFSVSARCHFQDDMWSNSMVMVVSIESTSIQDWTFDFGKHEKYIKFLNSENVKKFLLYKKEYRFEVDAIQRLQDSLKLNVSSDEHSFIQEIRLPDFIRCLKGLPCHNTKLNKFNNI